MTGFSRKKKVFWTILLLIDLLVIIGGWALYRHFQKKPQGVQLNTLAWQAGYLERGLTIPATGPRDGFWGQRMWAHTVDMPFGKIPINFKIDGLLNFDRFGRQRFRGSPEGTIRLFIVGGSVAMGAYASRIETTYAALMGRMLTGPIRLAGVTVLAGGGWTSVNEIDALAFALERMDVDLVMFLNGLNDLTQLKDRTYPDRVATYLKNMTTAADLLHKKGIPGIIALQPFLPEKTRKTAIENRILSLYDTPALAKYFPQIRAGLQQLANQTHLVFVDSSDALNAAEPTTFCDIWHFADPGHYLLAKRLAAGLAGFLKVRPIKGGH